jgi:hypothetical protein
VGYNRRDFPLAWNKPQKHFRMLGEFSPVVSYKAVGFSVVSHSRKVFVPLYPTSQKNLLRCIPQRRRFCSVVGYSREKRYTMQKNIFNLSASHLLQTKILAKVAA